MENTPAFHPLDYVSVVRRRLWWLVIPTVLAALVGAALALFLPREYTASATVGVALPTVSSQLIQNNESQRLSADERQRTIAQVLLSPAVIERVVTEEKLAEGSDPKQAADEVRSRVEVKTASADANQPALIDQMAVSYKDATPQLTQRVTNRLVDVFVEETSKKREVRAEETSAFIGDQVKASQARLSTLEERLRSAKEAFMGSLPEQTSANVAMVTGLQQQLETTTNATRGEQDRLSMIERQIEVTRAGAGAAAAPSDAPGAGSAVLSPASTRVAQVERELAVARSQYTEKHPEVIRLKDELARARAEAEADASKPEEERSASLRIDPTYRALVNDRDQSRLRIRELQRQEGQIRSQIGVYRTRVDSAPRVEQQIASLQREYDLEKTQYAALTAKLRNAEVAESLERTRGGEQFAVLQHAALPSTPTSPNVPRLLVVSLLLGLVLGGGLALGREYLDRSIYDTRALADTDVPVLGEIPRIPAHS